jgi:hypothetical protein
MLPDEQEIGLKKPQTDIEKKIIKEDREYKDRRRGTFDHGNEEDEKPKKKNQD